MGYHYNNNNNNNNNFIDIWVTSSDSLLAVFFNQELNDKSELLRTRR